MTKTVRVVLPLVLIAAVVGGALLYGPGLIGEIAYAVEANKAQAARDQLAELSKHDQLSVLFRAVAVAVKPAVVEVRVSKKVTAAVPEDFLRRFFPEGRGFGPSPFGTPREPRQREYFQRGLGSGVIVDAKHGYVVTNYHVVAGADEVKIVLADKRELKAEWVRTDQQTDLAVVKIKPERLVAAPLGDSDRMSVGDWVMAIGAPRGLAQTVTAGIVSAKGRSTVGDPSLYTNYIQTDAAINRGNSGGPLVNMRGEVIGINNSIVSYSGGFEGIGFAIPSNMVRTIKKQLIENKKVVRGYLGVRIQDPDEKLARSFRLPTRNGALVAEVMPGTPAAKAGLEPGDFVVAVNGKPTPSVAKLRNVVAAIPPGKTVGIELYRGGKKLSKKITLEAQPDEMTALAPGTPRGTPGEATAAKYGLRVTTLTADLAKQHGYDASVRGVLITNVDPASDAADQGMEPGLVVTHVQGKAVSSAGAFTKALAAADAKDGVRLRIQTPQGARRFVFITPKAGN